MLKKKQSDKNREGQMWRNWGTYSSTTASMPSPNIYITLENTKRNREKHYLLSAGPRKGRLGFYFYAFHYQKGIGAHFSLPPKAFLYSILPSLFLSLSLCVCLSLSALFSFYQLSILWCHMSFAHIHYTYRYYYSLLTPTPFLSSYLSQQSHRERERERVQKGLVLGLT